MYPVNQVSRLVLPGFPGTMTQRNYLKPDQAGVVSGQTASPSAAELLAWKPVTSGTGPTMYGQSTTHIRISDGSTWTHVKLPMTNPCFMR